MGGKVVEDKIVSLFVGVVAVQLLFSNRSSNALAIAVAAGKA